MYYITGLDLRPGREEGTWLGLNEQGKVGILLNLEPYESSKEKKGRGLSLPFLLHILMHDVWMT